MCQARTKPCSTDTGSKPLPTSLGAQFCSRRSWQLRAQQCSWMKELLLPEPSRNSGAPVCFCLPAQAPCQTLAGSAHAAPALSPETFLLATAHELLAHHITSWSKNISLTLPHTCTYQRGRGSLQRPWASVMDRDLQTRCHPGNSHSPFTLLLTQNSSFFNFSVISPDIFRASFKFSYSLQRDPKSHTVCKTAEPELLRNKPRPLN